jgi:hypothetical protein
MNDLTPLDLLCQVIERQGIANVNDITYSFFGIQQVRGDVYPVLTFTTDGQLKTVRKLLKRALREGRIEKLGSGRWTQYQLAKK